MAWGKREGYEYSTSVLTTLSLKPQTIGISLITALAFGFSRGNTR